MAFIFISNEFRGLIGERLFRWLVRYILFFFIYIYVVNYATHNKNNDML